MAVVKRKGRWYIYFRPFKKEKIGLRVIVPTKAQAKMIEFLLIRACRTGDFSGLDIDTREAALRLFYNRRWVLPKELRRETDRTVLTLWKAVELTLRSPDVVDNPNRSRHEQAFLHIVEFFGKDFPVENIWIPEVKAYQVERLRQGAAGSTVNKERAALSLLFQTLIEMNLVEHNPARMVKGVSEKDGQREVYISSEDFQRILSHLPDWMRPIAQTLYMTGMRRGEVLGLTWDNVDLEERIVRVHSTDTKERKSKRIPIHRDLLPVLWSLSEKRSSETGAVFTLPDGQSVGPGYLKRPWEKACALVGLDPTPNVHDLRHCWKTNAMRSGVDTEIREAILGHSLGIAGRYGRIADADLVQAIDLVTFDHGKTEVWVAREKKSKDRKKIPEKKGNKKVTRIRSQSVMSAGSPP